MNWLIVTISCYLIFALVSLVDKYLLTESIPNPKVYVFYVGTLSGLVLLLIPFVGFYFPSTFQIILSLSAGIVFICGLFWLYKTLQLFEVSRAVPAIGGLTPLFTFALVFLFSQGKETLSFSQIIALVFLVLGGVLITFKKEKLITLRVLKFSALAAFLLSLSFVLTKYVYLEQAFWNGFIWRTLGGFLAAVCFFILYPEIKKEVFGKKSKLSSSKKKKFSPKIALIFLANQAAGATGGILQNWAIALVPLAQVAFINAVQGVQYVFLLFLAFVLSFKFPHILKEEISGKIILQKIIAVLLIGLGLAVLAIYNS